MTAPVVLPSSRLWIAFLAVIVTSGGPMTRTVLGNVVHWRAAAISKNYLRGSVSLVCKLESSRLHGNAVERYNSMDSRGDRLLSPALYLA